MSVSVPSGTVPRKGKMFQALLRLIDKCLWTEKDINGVQIRQGGGGGQRTVIYVHVANL